VVELEWTRESTFTDGSRNFQAVGSGVYDVPEDSVEEYLDHHSGAWQRPSDGDNGTEDGDRQYPVLKGTVGELEAELEEGAFDGELDGLEEAERTHKDRETALEAIAERRDQLEQDEQDQ